MVTSTTVFVRSIVKKGHSLVVELTGCRLGCSKVMPDCMFGCISNPGRKVSIDEVLGEAQKLDCINIEVIGSLAQRRQFLQKLAEKSFKDGVTQ